MKGPGDIGHIWHLRQFSWTVGHFGGTSGTFEPSYQSTFEDLLASSFSRNSFDMHEKTWNLFLRPASLEGYLFIINACPKKSCNGMPDGGAKTLGCGNIKRTIHIHQRISMPKHVVKRGRSIYLQNGVVSCSFNWALSCSFYDRGKLCKHTPAPWSIWDLLCAPVIQLALTPASLPAPPAAPPCWEQWYGSMPWDMVVCLTSLPDISQTFFDHFIRLFSIFIRSRSWRSPASSSGKRCFTDLGRSSCIGQKDSIPLLHLLELLETNQPSSP